MKDLITTYFPDFRENELREKIINHSKLEKIPSNTVLLRQGQYVKYLPLVISGTIKVVRQESTKELLLYYIESGQSCAVSFTAYMNESKSEVKAITTVESEVILLPTQHINEWMRLYSSWQQFALSLYQKRFEDLLETVDNIAFKKMDQRLETYLIKKFENRDLKIELTHSQIAEDLGTSREVISRLLKQMEKEGKVSLARNYIKNIGLV